MLLFGILIFISGRGGGGVYSYIHAQGPPYMEVFPSLFPKSPHFSLDFPTNQANSITEWVIGLAWFAGYVGKSREKWGDLGKKLGKTSM